MTGSDSRTQTRRKRIIFHQTEDPSAIQKLAGHFDIRLMQACAHVQAEVLNQAAVSLEVVPRTGYTTGQDTRGGEDMKTATIRARTEPGLKADAERVFRKLGISSSEAINLFYSQVRLRKGLPFPVEIPNAVTRQTFEKTDRGEDLHEYPSLDDFFKKMGA